MLNIQNTVLYLRYDGWCICMGLSGRLVGSKESPDCHIGNECHLHSCLKLLSDIWTVHAVQISQWSCVSTVRTLNLSQDCICHWNCS